MAHGHSQQRIKARHGVFQHDAGPSGRIAPLGLNLSPLEWARLKQIREDLHLTDEDQRILREAAEDAIKLPKMAHHDGARFPMPQQAADETAAEAMARETRRAITKCPFCPCSYSNATALRFHVPSSHPITRDWLVEDVNRWLEAMGHIWKIDQRAWYNLGSGKDFQDFVKETSKPPSRANGHKKRKKKRRKKTAKRQ